MFRSVGRSVFASKTKKMESFNIYQLRRAPIIWLGGMISILVRDTSGFVLSPPSLHQFNNEQRYLSTFSNEKRSKTSHSASSELDGSDFRYGDEIQVEVTSFGPLGASVEVVAKSHNPEDVISETAPALGRGIIFQKEISYFRQARGYVDVVVGELLNSYVDRVREDGLLDIGLRKPGGKAKADDLSNAIMDALKQTRDGTLPIGDRSAVEDIQAEFPGVSKTTFKKAVAKLYKRGFVKPSPNSITLIE